MSSAGGWRWSLVLLISVLLGSSCSLFKKQPDPMAGHEYENETGRQVAG